MLKILKNLDIEITTEAQKLVISWGWEDAEILNLEMLQIAALSLNIAGKDTCEVAEYLGLCSLTECKRILQHKPAGERAFGWLGSQLTALQEDYFTTQAILALFNGYPAIPSLKNLKIHPGLPKDQEFFLEVEKMDAVLMLIDNRQPILIFKAFERLHKWVTKGREDELKNPFREIPNLKYGVAPPQDIQRELQRNKPTETAQTSINKTTGGHIWDTFETQGDPNKRKIVQVMEEALHLGATDVAIYPKSDGGGRVSIRIDGDLERPAAATYLTPNEYKEVLNYASSVSGANPNVSRINEWADGSFKFISTEGTTHVRTNFIPTTLGVATGDNQTVAIELRLFNLNKNNTFNLKKLNIHPLVIEATQKALNRPYGFILVCGPTNSGKSTTIAAMISQHVDLYGYHKKRVILADPVEFTLKGTLAISIPQNKKASFESYMQAILRHDPDMVSISEIRNRETATTTVWAASSGHLAFSTIHANDAAMGLKNIMNKVPEENHIDLFDCTSMVVSQRLLKRLCPHCKTEKITFSDRKIENLKHHCAINGLDSEKIIDELPERHFEPKENGCDQCRRGYSGVLPAAELLELTHDLKDHLYEGFNLHQIKKARRLTLFDSALEMFKSGDAEFGSIFI